MAREEGTYKGGSLQPSVGLQKNVSQEMLCKKEEGKGYLIKKCNDIRYVIRNVIRNVIRHSG